MAGKTTDFHLWTTTLFEVISFLMAQNCMNKDNLHSSHGNQKHDINVIFEHKKDKEIDTIMKVEATKEFNWKEMYQFLIKKFAPKICGEQIQDEEISTNNIKIMVEIFNTSSGSMKEHIFDMKDVLKFENHQEFCEFNVIKSLGFQVGMCETRLKDVVRDIKRILRQFYLIERKENTIVKSEIDGEKNIEIFSCDTSQGLIAMGPLKLSKSTHQYIPRAMTGLKTAYSYVDVIRSRSYRIRSSNLRLFAAIALTEVEESENQNHPILTILSFTGNGQPVLYTGENEENYFHIFMNQMLEKMQLLGINFQPLSEDEQDMLRSSYSLDINSDFKGPKIDFDIATVILCAESLEKDTSDAILASGDKIIEQCNGRWTEKLIVWLAKNLFGIESRKLKKVCSKQRSVDAVVKGITKSFSSIILDTKNSEFKTKCLDIIQAATLEEFEDNVINLTRNFMEQKHNYRIKLTMPASKEAPSSDFDSLQSHFIHKEKEMSSQNQLSSEDSRFLASCFENRNTTCSTPNSAQYLEKSPQNSQTVNILRDAAKGMKSPQKNKDVKTNKKTSHRRKSVSFRLNPDTSTNKIVSSKKSEIELKSVLNQRNHVQRPAMKSRTIMTPNGSSSQMYSPTPSNASDGVVLPRLSQVKRSQNPKDKIENKLQCSPVMDIVKDKVKLAISRKGQKDSSGGFLAANYDVCDKSSMGNPSQEGCSYVMENKALCGSLMKNNLEITKNNDARITWTSQPCSFQMCHGDEHKITSNPYSNDDGDKNAKSKRPFEADDFRSNKKVKTAFCNNGPMKYIEEYKTAKVGGDFAVVRCSKSSINSISSMNTSCEGVVLPRLACPMTQERPSRSSIAQAQIPLALSDETYIKSSLSANPTKLQLPQSSKKCLNAVKQSSAFSNNICPAVGRQSYVNTAKTILFANASTIAGRVNASSIDDNANTKSSSQFTVESSMKSPVSCQGFSIKSPSGSDFQALCGYVLNDDEEFHELLLSQEELARSEEVDKISNAESVPFTEAVLVPLCNQGKETKCPNADNQSSFTARRMNNFPSESRPAHNASITDAYKLSNEIQTNDKNVDQIKNYLLDDSTSMKNHADKTTGYFKQSDYLSGNKEIENAASNCIMSARNTTANASANIAINSQNKIPYSTSTRSRASNSFSSPSKAISQEAVCFGNFNSETSKIIPDRSINKRSTDFFDNKVLVEQRRLENLVFNSCNDSRVPTIESNQENYRKMFDTTSSNSFSVVPTVLYHQNIDCKDICRPRSDPSSDFHCPDGLVDLGTKIHHDWFMELENAALWDDSQKEVMVMSGMDKIELTSEAEIQETPRTFDDVFASIAQYTSDNFD